MKINRLIEITVLLLNRDVITAKELANRFDVSVRTIYRDIEDLSLAGVPVYMSKGKGGGISILKDFSINKALLSQQEKESLVMALKTLQVTKLPEIHYTLEKISTLFNDIEEDEWVQVDFSSWGSNPNENNKFTSIKEAIINRNVIRFLYINAEGSFTNRDIEPIRLIYKGQGWYLYGYCRLKNSFRVFRISRIKKLEVKPEKFIRRNNKIIDSLEYEDSTKKMVKLRLRFSNKALTRIYDDFDEIHINKNINNTYDVNISFPEDEWVYGYIMSFGNNVEVIEPHHIKELIINRLKEAINLYDK